MFYSHELLTSRKYGVATVWIVATLGSKSGMRRVTRKAIQGVNIEKVCATVSDAESQPLALRLQSNLLYGISRVYFQQCEYVLVDAQHAQNSLRTLWKHVIESQGLDPNAGRAKPENLIVPDDPGFLPDELVPDLTIDLSLFDSSVVSSSNPSVLSGGAQASSGSDASVIGIEVPSSVSGGVNDTTLGPHLGTVPPFGIDFEDDEGFDPNIGFGFDEEGNLFDIPPAPQDVELPARARSESHDSIRARLAFENDLPGEHIPDDMDMTLASDDHVQVLPEAEAFPNAPLESGTEAPTVQRKRSRRPIPMDKTLQLRHSDMAQMDNDYVQNMAAAKKHKITLRNAHQARKNAFYYVLGRGLGDTGLLHGKLVGPLAQFSGAALYHSLTGIDLNASVPISKKRSASPDRAASINKRARPEVGRGQEDDSGDVLPLFEDSIEVGREAPVLPRYDEHSSQMPWNQPGSSRATSRQGSALRSAPGTGLVQRSIDRTSAPQRQIASSPLHGRGPGQHFTTLKAGAVPGPGSELGEDDLLLPLSGPDTSPAGGFELPSLTPASQPMPWSTTLDADAKRFLAFVCSHAHEKPVDTTDIESTDIAKATTFGKLFLPTQHTRLVAVQAFMHLLTLANEGCIMAEQTRNASEESEIWVGVKKGYEDVHLQDESELVRERPAEMMDVDVGAINDDEEDASGGSREGDEVARIARLRF